MTQVLDHSKDCAACSTPLTSPPRDGTDSMCAYLHTRQGRRDLVRNIKRNLGAKRVVDEATPAVTSPKNDVTPRPNDVTILDEVTPNEVTLPDDVTVEELIPNIEVTDETRAQRHRRLHRDEINQKQRDRRNGLST